MQLILDTETTVDLKTKMSLNQENLEKSVPDILPGVQNGGISNGEATNGDIKPANKDTDKLEKLKDSVEVDTERLLENNTDSVLENTKESVADHQTDSLLEHNSESPVEPESTDVINGNNSNSMESVANEESTEETHKTSDENAHKLIETEETKNDTVDNDVLRNVIENNSKEESLPAIVKNEPVDKSESTVTEHIGNNIEAIPDSECNNDSSTNTGGSECVTIKKEFDETSPSASLTTEVILDNLEIKRETPSAEPPNAESTSAELDIKIEVPDETQVNLETDDDSIKLQSVKTETEENMNISEEIEPMETDNLENDTSDENVDLIRLNFSEDNYDKQSDSGPDVKEDTEKEQQSAIDPVEKEGTKSDDATDMDVDTSIDNVIEKETSEIGSTATTANAIECLEQKDSETLEPTTDNSDDVIVDLDDDKEKSTEPTDIKESETAQIIVDDDKPIINCDDVAEITDETEKLLNKDPNPINEVIDLDENVPKETVGSDLSDDESKKQPANNEKSTLDNSQPIVPILKLSNTLDILSDDEEDQIQNSEVPKSSNTDSKCINIEDDDDVMLIDDEPSGIEDKPEPIKEPEIEKQLESNPKSPTETVKDIEDSRSTDKIENPPEQDNKATEKEEPEPVPISDIGEKVKESPIQPENKKPLIPENFLKTCKKNLVDMTREELEEFCILKIVESLLDRSNLSEIKNKQKILTQNIEDYKKKAMMLAKQNRDLQVVLKSVQEDVKKYNATPIVPLKITRSVGMQVLMSDKIDKRRRTGIGMPNPNANKVMRTPTMQSPRPQKPPTQQIPVPRLVPANSPAMKSPVQQVNAGKVTSPLPNGIKSVSPTQKAEKRPHNRIQSVTVDLTDDEPPAKVVTRPAPVPPVRLVPSQNLLATPRTPPVNSPRKVYIPISAPQSQNVRPGQTIMLKTVANANTRPRVPPPHMVRMPQSIRMARPQGLRHPAPLPECMKQYQPPNWKALPPAPDLKLAKVENGIVISWKIEGYQEDSYEEIASYQLYAYQETTSPPNTALWKKIGDVKALPLPMACTLTQFMAGYKYYFAVRAVDIRSRLGPFSLPGSILLLNKM